MEISHCVYASQVQAAVVLTRGSLYFIGTVNSVGSSVQYIYFAILYEIQTTNFPRRRRRRRYYEVGKVSEKKKKRNPLKTIKTIIRINSTTLQRQTYSYTQRFFSVRD